MAEHGRLMGAPVDYARPKLANPDGSFSTEETTTIERDGNWFNVPTIVNGQRVDPEIVEILFDGGRIEPVGKFASEQEATESARYRSMALAMMRGIE